MQEPQMTSAGNLYFDLVSIAYNSLQAAQSAAAYVRDAQEIGNQQLAQFFEQYRQLADQQAKQAQQLLAQVGQQGASSTRGTY
jgi:ferritin-like metal-binding protein YciE